MDLISKITIKTFCNQVGFDEFGNQYFESKKTLRGNKKRFVIYKGSAEPSKVPPHWHGWLHYTHNDLPKNIHKYSWQKTHLPNLTGTKFAHLPLGIALSNGKQSGVISNYQSWKPNQ